METIELLTGDEVMAMMDGYFEFGQGNPVLQAILHTGYKQSGQVPMVVRRHFGLEKISNVQETWIRYRYITKNPTHIKDYLSITRAIVSGENE